VTAAAPTRLPLRVMVLDAWDTVAVALDPAATIADLKREALARAHGRPAVAEDYVVKLRGAPVLDETTTLAALGVSARTPLIVLPARRQPVR
jgi:hypothetical protein